MLRFSDGKVLESFLIRFYVPNYPVSESLLTYSFLLKNRSLDNAKIGLIGNDKLPYKLIVSVE